MPLSGVPRLAMPGHMDVAAHLRVHARVAKLHGHGHRPRASGHRGDRLEAARRLQRRHHAAIAEQKERIRTGAHFAVCHGGWIAANLRSPVVVVVERRLGRIRIAEHRVHGLRRRILHAIVGNGPDLLVMLAHHVQVAATVGHFERLADTRLAFGVQAHVSHANTQADVRNDGVRVARRRRRQMNGRAGRRGGQRHLIAMDVQVPVPFFAVIHRFPQRWLAFRHSKLRR